MTSCCIGITSYNCLPYLVHNIDTIRMVAAGASLNIFVIVNDNASTDGTQKWLADTSCFGYKKENSLPNLKLEYCLNSFNGYASYGCHQSIDYFLHQTNADYFLHLDPDCEFRTTDVLTKAISQLSSDPLLGAVGEKRHALRYQHPTSRSLRLFDQYIMGGEWALRFGPKAPGSLFDILTEPHPNKNFRVYNELCGNVMLFKRSVIKKIGNIDVENYKMWRWDSEYSMRVLLWGYKLAEADIVKNRDVYHFGGRSRENVDNHESYLRKVLADSNMSEEKIKQLFERYS